jgi:hypothetical protein
MKIEKPVLVKIYAECFLFMTQEEYDKMKLQCDLGYSSEYSYYLISWLNNPKFELVKTSTSALEKDGVYYSNTESILVPENGKIASIDFTVKSTKLEKVSTTKTISAQKSD